MDMTTTQIIVLRPILITKDAFQPYGQVIFATPDGQPYDQTEAQLVLDQGIPRFYIMKLTETGLTVTQITQHLRCTQCLGSLGGREWFLVVAPPSTPEKLDLGSIKAFQIPGDCFIKLEVGTWHAGPLFSGDPIDFFNLELADTNITDHFTVNLTAQSNIIFQIKPHLLNL